MILGKDREAVIRNIKAAAESGDFYAKVETGDPVLTPEESRAITQNYTETRGHLQNRFAAFFARRLANVATAHINRDTEIVGAERIPPSLRGVLITSNHFDPLENTVIRHLTRKLGRRRLHIISQTGNFAMTGILGFLMRHADTIPISAEPRYLARDLTLVLREKLVEKGEAVLLYPEQEMWFRYRKPRPPKNGAYYYAAKLGVPILSCFVEIVDTEKEEAPDFRAVRFVLHILGVLTPDPERSVKENTERLATEDYALKCACYERVYRKKLTYDFDPADIAGWKGTL